MLPTLAAWLHDLDPFALWPIRWYGLSYLAGFLVGMGLLRWMGRRAATSIPPHEAIDLVVAVAISGVLGGRLGYVVFYRPELLLEFSSAFPFWEAIAINRGGMSSHGGMIGGLVGCIWFGWKHHHRLPHLLDVLAFCALPGLMFGRLANFINGELFGRPADPQLPWAVKFPQEIYLYEPQRLALAIDAAAPPEVAARGPNVAVRWIIEQIQAGNAQVQQAIAPILTPRHPSQLYEAALEGLLLFVVLAIIWSKPRKPGVIAGWFGISYGIARIIGEQFRMPDEHLLDAEFALWGITRGQWLSLLLALAGVGLVVVFGKLRASEKMGPWYGRSDPGTTDGQPAEAGE